MITTLKTARYGVGGALFFGVYFYHASTIQVTDSSWTAVWERRGSKLMLEFIICCVLYIPPGADVVFTMESLGFEVPYHINNIGFLFCMIRWRYVVRYFQVTSRASIYPKAKAVARVGDVNTKSYLFVYKDLMHCSPVLTLAVLGAGSILLLAYLHRLSERSFRIPGHIRDHADHLSAPEYFTNSLWYIIVTIFTVGYGDMYSRTLVGRGVAVIVMFLGLFFTSLFVALVMQYTQNTPLEQGLVELMDAEEASMAYREAAAIVMQLHWRERARQTKLRESGEEGRAIDRMTYEYKLSQARQRIQTTKVTVRAIGMAAANDREADPDLYMPILTQINSQLAAMQATQAAQEAKLNQLLVHVGLPTQQIPATTGISGAAATRGEAVVMADLPHDDSMEPGNPPLLLNPLVPKPPQAGGSRLCSFGGGSVI